jgi:hypothetical protein
MNEIFTYLLEAVITAVIGATFAVFIPKLAKYSDSVIGKANTDQIIKWADIVAQMAEKKYGAKTGDLKFDIALDALKGFNDRHDLHADETTLKTAIEAAVYKLDGNFINNFVSSVSVADPATLTGAVPTAVPTITTTTTTTSVEPVAVAAAVVATPVVETTAPAPSDVSTITAPIVVPAEPQITVAPTF